MEALVKLQEFDYPASEENRMAKSNQHISYEIWLYKCLLEHFDEREDVYVAMDMFWYPLENSKTTRLAPDVLLVFGRPLGERTSYIQCLENNIPVHVAFEVLSKSNDKGEMQTKLVDYERFGVEEYYIINPEGQWNTLNLKKRFLRCYKRENGRLIEIINVKSWFSPLLNLRFGVNSDGCLSIYDENDELQFSYQAAYSAFKADFARKKADNEMKTLLKEIAERERKLKEEALKQKNEALKQKEEERKQKEEALRQKELLEQKLRELGLEPNDIIN